MATESELDYAEAIAPASGAATRMTQHRPAHINKAEKALRNLESKSGLTPEGKAWFLQSVDPFHDHRYVAQGFPDGHGDRSIVQLVERSIELAAPPDIVASGAKWDCHIYTAPTALGGQHANYCVRSGEMVASDVNDPNTVFSQDFGMINVSAGQVGMPTLPGGSTALPATALSGAVLRTSLSPVKNGPTSSAERDSTFLNGSSRIVSAGIEVVNTTPPLYRGGMCTTYRSNESADPAFLNFGTAMVGGIAQVNATSALGACPPSNLDAVYLLGDIEEHEAGDGAYVTMTLRDKPTFQYPRPSAIVLDGIATGPGGAPNTVAGPFDGLYGHSTYDPAAVGPAGGALSLKNNHLHQFDTSGIYFTGLSPQTTLRMNARWVVERRPTVHDGDLVVLARPVAQSDPIAWALYAEARNRMKSGAVLTDNAFGTWFRDVVKSVEHDVLPTIPKLILPAAVGYATGGPAGAIEAVAADVASRANRRQKKRNRERLEEEVGRATLKEAKHLQKRK